MVIRRPRRARAGRGAVAVRVPRNSRQAAPHGFAFGRFAFIFIALREKLRIPLSERFFSDMALYFMCLAPRRAVFLPFPSRAGAVP